MERAVEVDGQNVSALVLLARLDSSLGKLISRLRTINEPLQLRQMMPGSMSRWAAFMRVRAIGSKPRPSTRRRWPSNRRRARSEQPGLPHDRA